MGKYGDDKAQRGFVIQNDTWTTAATRAAEEGVSISSVIRAALEAYADGEEGVVFADALSVEREVAEARAAAKAAMDEAKAKIAEAKAAAAKIMAEAKAAIAAPKKAAPAQAAPTGRSRPRGSKAATSRRTVSTKL